MTAREAHKEQWNKLKDKPLKDKLKYIFTYYWAAILGVVCVIAFAVSWIGGALSQKDTALAGYLLNSIDSPSYSGDLAQEFMEHQQIDSNTYECKLHSNVSFSSSEMSETSIAVLESIVVQIASGDLDFIVTDLETYPTLSAYYADLRTVLDEAQLEKYSAYFVYAEKKALDELTDEEIEDQLVLPEYYLDKTDLLEPVPLGIRIPESSRLLDAYSFPPGDVILGITQNTKNLANILSFLEYIVE